MKIAVDCKVNISDDSRNKSNTFGLESIFTGSDTPDAADSTKIINNYEVDQVLKTTFVLDATTGSGFNKRLKEDILSGIDISKITGVQISCYNSTEADTDSNPLQFELWDSIADVRLMTTSFFASYNILNFDMSLQVKNLTNIPSQKTVNIVFIVTLKK